MSVFIWKYIFFLSKHGLKVLVILPHWDGSNVYKLSEDRVSLILGLRGIASSMVFFWVDSPIQGSTSFGNCTSKISLSRFFETNVYSSGDITEPYHVILYLFRAKSKISLHSLAKKKLLGLQLCFLMKHKLDFFQPNDMPLMGHASGSDEFNACKYVCLFRV